MQRLHRRFLSLALGALALVTSVCSAAPFEDTIAQRVLACTGCHGEQGRAGPDGYYPRLAGKPVAYLYSQLRNFRDGKRTYPLMTGLLDTLSDAYLWEMAQYFSTLDLPYPAPQPSQAGATVLSRGQTLATRGDTALGLPACAQCHGTALTGVLPNVPGLLGLPRDYLNAQLGRWNNAQRHTPAPDCMASVAKKLSGPDVSAVAHWLSTQPVPRNAKAVPAPAAKLALAPEFACANAPSGAPTTVPLAAAPDPVVRRGAYLARVGNCALCHTARGGDAYAGGRGIETPFGTVYSNNITPDPTQGIGLWSSQDFWQALHNGRSKDGHLLNPVFPYTSYTHVTRDNSDAIYAYLKTQAPSSRPNTAHALRWPYSTQTALWAWRALNFTPAAPASNLSISTEQTPRDRGAYLVQGLGHCSACHTRYNALGAIDPRKALAGGLMPQRNWYAPSLLDSNEGAVSSWSTPEVIALLKTGTAPQGQASGPMAEVVVHSTQYLSDADAGAIAEYLRSLPLTKSPAAASTTPAKPNQPVGKGAAIYEDHCAQCHGKQGQGQAGAYPALARSRAVNLADASNLVQMVLYGGFPAATTGFPRPFGMPPFVLKLSDQEVAAVVTYIRTSWGNNAAAVGEFDINRLRTPQHP